MIRAIAFLMVMVLAAGCATKDEKARTNIARTWRISKVFQNGSDVTTSYLDTHVDYKISFTNSGSFQEDYRPFSGGDLLTVTGTWDFSDGSSKITLVDNNRTRLFSVDALDEDNFNVTDLGSSTNREIQFIPN